MKIRFLRKMKLGQEQEQDLNQDQDRAQTQSQIQKKSRRERGASLVEYGLLVALIAVMGIPAVTMVGENVAFTFADSNLNEAVSGTADHIPP